MGVETIMREEARRQYEEIGRMQLGSEEYSRAVKGANEMMDRLYEAEKIGNEAKRIEVEEQKAEMEKKRLEDDRRDRRTQLIFNSVIFGVSLVTAVWANVDSKNFERTDTHTTDAGRHSTRSLLSILDRFKKI